MGTGNKNQRDDYRDPENYLPPFPSMRHSAGGSRFTGLDRSMYLPARPTEQQHNQHDEYGTVGLQQGQITNPGPADT